MAKFKNSNLQLKTGQKIELGDNQEANLIFDGSNIKINVNGQEAASFNESGFRNIIDLSLNNYISFTSSYDGDLAANVWKVNNEIVDIETFLTGDISQNNIVIGDDGSTHGDVIFTLPSAWMEGMIGKIFRIQVGTSNYSNTITVVGNDGFGHPVFQSIPTYFYAIQPGYEGIFIGGALQDGGGLNPPQLIYQKPFEKVVFSDSYFIGDMPRGISVLEIDGPLLLDTQKMPKSALSSNPQYQLFTIFNFLIPTNILTIENGIFINDDLTEGQNIATFNGRGVIVCIPYSPTYGITNLMVINSVGVYFSTSSS